MMDPRKLKNFTDDEQRDINLVRIHLQALYISDITTGDGLTITTSHQKGNPCKNRT